MTRDDLFAVTPREFTAARKALAKEDPSVARLKKPAWPLWAVNQLGRRHAREVKALLDAGGALEKTHRAVLKGQASAEDLREAAAAHHAALAALEGLAAGALRGERAGTGPAVIRRVRATLHAASIGDDDARRHLRQGTLEDELEPPDVLAGMADLGPLPKPRPRPAASRTKKDQEAARRAEAEARARARAEKEAAKLEAKAARLEAEARELRRRARELRG